MRGKKMKDKIQYLGKSLVIEEDKKIKLIIGDLHLGYEASLNATGVFVTRTLIQDAMKDFELIFNKIGKVEEIILLGDVKHTFGSILKEEWKETDKVISYLKEKSKKIVVIKGNHDQLTDIIGKKIGFDVVDYYESGEFIFIHGDRDFEEIWGRKTSTVVMGHMHPAITITDSVKKEKYTCFLKGNYKGKEIIILPSFISANEGTDPRDYPTVLPWNLNLSNFEVCIVGGDLEVLRFGKLRNIK